jgi:hypothetical protein
LAWRKANGGNFPERIMFYRDGVGEGQLQSVFSEELDSIKVSDKVECNRERELSF